MLPLPTKGLRRSVFEHNIDLIVLADWCEACVLFTNEEISQSDVIDCLMEGEIYNDQTFAAEIVEDAWSQLSRRARWLGSRTPFAIKQRRIIRLADWRNVPAYSFCLLVALLPYNGAWSKKLDLIWNDRLSIVDRYSRSSFLSFRTGSAEDERKPGRFDDESL
jgi:hypothetical protein